MNSKHIDKDLMEVCKASQDGRLKKMMNSKRKGKQWKRYPRYDKKELMCEHGVGHGGMHGCDGCCSDPSFKVAWKKIFGGEPI